MSPAANSDEGSGMNNGTLSGRSSLRLAAWLLLAGQLLYIVVTLFHADGDANHHAVAFAEYARSGIWTAVHVGQFASMAVLLAGLFAVFFALDAQAETMRWTSRFGVAAAAVTLALYGVLQAVDGVALKQAVNAWASAPESEQAARFATAEAIRWLEWGVRSYQDFALGLALLLLTATLARTAWAPLPIAYLVGLSGISYLVQGGVVGSEGFSRTETIAIVSAYILDVAWMIWLVAVASRVQDSKPPLAGR
jgi:hypothetical protein